MCKISIWDIRSSGCMYGLVRCIIESTAVIGIDNLVLAILNRHDYDSERLLSLYSYLSCEQYIALCRASNPYLIVPQILIEWQQTRIRPKFKRNPFPCRFSQIHLSMSIFEIKDFC